MDTKPLLYGLIGFMLGGLLVSIAATTFEKPAPENHADDANIVSQLRELEGDEFDKLYLDHMVAHHQDAVDMSRLADERAKHIEIKQLAFDITKAQQKEIIMMQNWQEDWGYGEGSHSH